MYKLRSEERFECMFCLLRTCHAVESQGELAIVIIHGNPQKVILFINGNTFYVGIVVWCVRNAQSTYKVSNKINYNTYFFKHTKIKFCSTLLIFIDPRTMVVSRLSSFSFTWWRGILFRCSTGFFFIFNSYSRIMQKGVYENPYCQ